MYIKGIPLNYSSNCGSKSIDCGEVSPEPKQYKDKKFQKLQGWFRRYGSIFRIRKPLTLKRFLYLDFPTPLSAII